MASMKTNKKEKYYAVSNGRTIGIFSTWNQASQSVTGFPHATHQSFNSLEAALSAMKLAGHDEPQIYSADSLEQTKTEQMEKLHEPSTIRRKLVIDVDTGLDDAHAIMMALANSEMDVLAITCANGNVRIDDVVDNTLRVLQVCGRMEVPVHKGASRSLLGEVSRFDNCTASAWKTPVDRSLIQTEEHAANVLVRLVNQFPGEITLAAMAPLTNIALAVNLDPDFAKKLKDIVIMGGSIEAKGRVSPCAEFNFFNDPEAAHIVLGSMRSVRLLPYEVCCHHLLSWDFMEKWTGKDTPQSNFVRDSLEFDLSKARSSERKGFRTCDGLAMAVAIDGSIVTEEKEVYATVELAGQLTRGQLVVDWAGVLGKASNVRLIMGLDMAKTEHMLLSMVSN